MIIFQIIFGIFMMLVISNCETSNGSMLGLCIWLIISFLIFIINKEGKKITQIEKNNNIKRLKSSEIYYNNYGELP